MQTHTCQVKFLPGGALALSLVINEYLNICIYQRVN